MDKQLEYFDMFTNAQKQIFRNLVNIQKDLRVQWVSAVGKTYKAFTSIPGLPETEQTRNVLNQLNTWFGAVEISSISASEEALKTQESWISSYEKQMETSRGVLKNFVELATPEA